MAATDAYVRRMLINELLSWRRKWSRLIPHAAPAELSSAPIGPDHSTIIAERDELVAAVRRLPPRQRVVLALRYFADLDDEQIADALGCSQSTVRVHAARALAQLRTARARPSLAAKEGDNS